MTQQLQLEKGSARLLRRVLASVRARRLFGPGEHLLVAISGGPDSVALLSLLATLAPSWCLTVSAVHVNHGLRGAESEEDACFVRGLCDRLGVPVVCERADLVHAAGVRRRRSLQEEAREARYAVLSRVARTVGADKIALGHTADDQAETLLMWMLRGSGTKGLAGMPPARESLFIRPLLDIPRSELLAHLEARGLEFRLDSSNTKPIYLRNRVRQELLPVLRRFNPGIVGVLRRQADILREEDRYLEELAAGSLLRCSREDTNGEVVLDRDALLAQPLALQRRVLRAVIRRVSGAVRGPAFRAVTDVLERVVHGRSGSGITVQGARVTRDYSRLRVQPRCSQMDPGRVLAEGQQEVTTSLVVPVPSVVRWPLTDQRIRVQYGPPVPDDRDVAGKRSRHTAVFDADRFTMALRVRSWKPGDVFHPAGMQGHRKKLQDYFSDLKLPRAARRRIPLLVAPEGILWVVGHRADQRFCATPCTTRPVSAELLDQPRGGQG